VFAATAVTGGTIVDHSALLMKEPRRFPPPWSVEDYNSACFIVRDANGQRLPMSIMRMSRGGDSAAKLLSKESYRSFCARAALTQRLPLVVSAAWADATKGERQCHRNSIFENLRMGR